MRFYTDMRLVLRALGERVCDFDWLITNLECNRHPEPLLPLDQESWWFSGTELVALVEMQDDPIQFIWGVFSGVPAGSPRRAPMPTSLVASAGSFPRLWILFPTTRRDSDARSCVSEPAGAGTVAESASEQQRQAGHSRLGLLELVDRHRVHVETAAAQQVRRARERG
jgi:hypothetical protein